MNVHEIVYDPETDTRNVFRRSLPIGIITGIGESVRDPEEGRVFIRNGAKIITVENFFELTKLYSAAKEANGSV